jgi:hypothetical protein
MPAVSKKVFFQALMTPAFVSRTTTARCGHAAMPATVAAASSSAAHDCRLQVDSAGNGITDRPWRVALECAGGSKPSVSVHPNASFVLNGRDRAAPTACPRAACDSDSNGGRGGDLGECCVLTFCGGSGSVRLSRSLITGVNAPQLAGVVCAAGGVDLSFSDADISNNTARNGALRALGLGTRVALSNSTLRSNVAVATSDDKGGAHVPCGKRAFFRRLKGPTRHDGVLGCLLCYLHAQCTAGDTPMGGSHRPAPCPAGSMIC